MLNYLLSFFNITIPTLIWYYIGDIIYYFYNRDFKVARNITSAIHALTVIMAFTLNFNFSPLLLYYSSRGYYIIDTLYEITTFKTAMSMSLYQIGMLLHHGVTLITLNYLLDPRSVNYIFYCYFLAEVSNVPMYIMRHLHSKNIQNKYIMKFILFLEFAAYFVLRMIMCIPIMYSVFNDSKAENVLKSMTVIMYSISGYWTSKLFGQLIK